ncbi:hypothetical protein Phi4:1_gp036 [Cellulophaga phage phi4:1]|uniref:YspA cpYpsA-related SLOG domain-containing protein n=5 Tax=Lightbulbvirus TaxID=1918522 RepID=A0A0S2MWK3_9CAUD|nr:hypothetical protein Phi4:1_gp036 [Cellulophaga phage phi4:1]YP_008241532.1 hypothetical protein Phi17:2_gp037 [Cellulophaga phage phi17:2]ALO80045.1 hypothetical protein Phi4113_036 [Cellulophaga phage phi4:1_13]ALO80242.1 hypothetical protein Phi4118_036 [Cellulophaga phage phi4:1_18]ALO80440.1 hypothetical protein Phi17218_037 [Cellulophaga phage phi17:2_18]AGO47570.1 hypothetical protein Phi17:2_gp037 [Cellulophaga phage phi17:2]AGO49449.1 hypothetical protein Phi4:1_gp036 [Cellulophag
MFKIIIAGGRDFCDYPLLKIKCDSLLKNIKEEIVIVSGKAKGADSLGERYAEEKGYLIKYFPADWEKYNKGAGHIRNKQMAEYSDALVLFWDGKSRGSANMKKEAEKEKLKIRVITYEL